MTISTLLLALAVSAQPAVPVDARSGRGTASISYETSPCFGTCPVYRVTVNADGRGVFEGLHHTRVSGRRNFRVTPAQYRAFVDRLAPIRPAAGTIDYRDSSMCERMATDHASVTVRWRDVRRGDVQELDFNYGCHDARYADMATRLRDAPRLLPLRALVGSRL